MVQLMPQNYGLVINLRCLFVQMSKVKYFYNTKTLRYEKYVVPFRKRVLQALYWLSSMLLFSFVVLFVGYQYLDSPKEKKLRREILHLTENFQQLEERVRLAEQVMVDLQQRDNEIYRAVFEADKIPDAVYLSGINNPYRYEVLEGFDHSEWLTGIAQRIDRLSKQVYIQSKSYDELWELVRNQKQMLASIPAILPLHIRDLKKMASGFGYRIDPIYKTRKFHAGMDFVAEVGTPIYATGNGVVERADRESTGYGNHVRIRHGYGYLTLYAHMSKILVRPGQKVMRGDVIGLVGNTGKSVGPHLHYEVHRGGQPVDPVNYYFTDLTAEEYAEILRASQQAGQSFD